MVQRINPLPLPGPLAIPLNAMSSVLLLAGGLLALIVLTLVWLEPAEALRPSLRSQVAAGLVGGVVSALLLVIGNTIRLHIENRRTEIEVIKLVGGTDSYVRRPFLYMGALYGVGAGLLAWLVLAFGLDCLNDAVVRLAGLYGSDFTLGGVPAGDARLVPDTGLWSAYRHCEHAYRASLRESLRRFHPNRPSSHFWWWCSDIRF